MRRDILPPILPSPITPICIFFTPWEKVLRVNHVHNWFLAVLTCGSRALAGHSDRRKVENDTGRHIAMLESLEHLVDCRKRLQLDIGLDLAFGGKGECFGHVLPSSDERTANGDTVRHDIEERDWKFTRRQPDQDTGATLAGHSDALFECRQGRRCD